MTTLFVANPAHPGHVGDKKVEWSRVIAWVMTSIRFIDALLGGGPPAGDAAVRPTDAEALDAYSLTVTSVAELLIPSVASLKVSRRTRGGRSAEGSGSGVVITADGYILTNNHVVEGADEVKVSIGESNKRYDARIVGRAARDDKYATA